MKFGFHLSVGLLTAVLAVVRADASDLRFTAVYEDGSVETSNQLGDALIRSDTDGGRGNRLRYLRDWHVKVEFAGPYVQFANGDILPGKVIRVVPADPKAGRERQMIVEATPPLFVDADVREIAVRVDRVVRIATHSSPQREMQPGTLWLNEGPLVRFSAIKWTEDGLTALTDKGMVRASFQELQEYHANEADAWGAMIEDAAVHCPDPEVPLVRIQMRNGAVLTTRRIMEVSRVVYLYGRNDWVTVAPSWAPGCISFEAKDVAWRSYRSPSEVPLSLLKATTLAQRSFTGFVWPWQHNRGVRGGELTAGTMRSALGFGMHAYTALAFDVPPGVAQFTSWVGLDSGVGRGGCVQCSVFGDDLKGEPLWQSGYLRGSDGPVKVTPTDIGEYRRLILVVDFGHEGRPEGADAMDILDEVNWLAPMLILDKPVPTRRPEVEDILPEIARWNVPAGTFGDMSVVLTYAKGEGPTDAVFIDLPSEVRIQRTLTVTEDTAMLRMAATRGRTGAGGHRIGLFANGECVRTVHRNEEALSTAGFHVPLYQMRREWDLRDHLGKEVSLELVMTPEKKEPEPLAGLVLGSLELLSYEEVLDEKKQTAEPADNHIVVWQMSGPYPGDPKTVFDTPFGPEPPETENAKWSVAPMMEKFSRQIVDFGSIYGGVNRAAYLRCVVVSSARQEVLLELGTDDGVKVWLNKELVHSNDHAGGLRNNHDKVDMVLNQGDNELLLKVVNRPGSWAAWAKIAKRDGSSLYGNVSFRLD